MRTVAFLAHSVLIGLSFAIVTSSPRLDEIVASNIAYAIAPAYVEPTDAELQNEARSRLAIAMARYEEIEKQRKSDPCYVPGDVFNGLPDYVCRAGRAPPRPNVKPELSVDEVRQLHFEQFYEREAMSTREFLVDFRPLRASSIVGFLLAVWAVVVLRLWLKRTAWPLSLRWHKWIESQDLFNRAAHGVNVRNLLEQRRLRRVHDQYETLEGLRSAGLITEVDFQRRKAELKTKLSARNL